LISPARYIGLAGSGLGGRVPQTKIFSHQCLVIFNQWGIKPPNPSPDKLNAGLLYMLNYSIINFFQPETEDTQLQVSQIPLTISLTTSSLLCTFII